MFAGGSDVFNGYPGQDALSCTLPLPFLNAGISRWMLRHHWAKAPPYINPNSQALRTGLIFGAVETLTPLIGWGWDIGE